MELLGCCSVSFSGKLWFCKCRFSCCRPVNTGSYLNAIINHELGPILLREIESCVSNRERNSELVLNCIETLRSGVYSTAMGSTDSLLETLKIFLMG